MIKRNELRLGNLIVRPPAVGVLTVAMINSSDDIWFEELPDNSFDLEEQEFEGISLNPEWLERMGFLRKDKSTRIGEGHYWLSHHVEIVESITNEKGMLLFATESSIGKPFHYVHQLQNLYFALTGEELTIKP